MLADYRTQRPAGDKQQLRQTDRLAGARSPMMLCGVPVAKMFFRGAPRYCERGSPYCLAGPVSIRVLR